jgi:hypothetical protein
VERGGTDGGGAGAIQFYFAVKATKAVKAHKKRSSHLCASFLCLLCLWGFCFLGVLPRGALLALDPLPRGGGLRGDGLRGHDATHALREERVGGGGLCGAEGAVRVPLVAPAILIGVEVLARVGLEERLRPRVVVLVRPALRAREALAHGGAALAFRIRRPLALGGLLVAVQELARRVDLVNVAITALATRVEVLLVLGVAEHAIGLGGKRTGGGEFGGILLTLGPLLGGDGGLDGGKLLVGDIGPAGLLGGRLDDVPLLTRLLALPPAVFNGLGGVAAAAGGIRAVLAVRPEGRVQDGGGLGEGRHLCAVDFRFDAKGWLL